MFSDDGVLVLRSIRVVYKLEGFEGKRELVDRIHRVHAQACPIYRSIHRAIEITTDYELAS